jgi:alpha-D-ribose 1-methylphosphonate 5-triphosphate synthase subunit PhnH
MTASVAPAPTVGAACFADPVLDAQRVFRAILDAFAMPARPVELGVEVPDGPIPPAALGALLTLVDIDTLLWIDPLIDASVAKNLRFHTGVRTTDDPGLATFALLSSPDGLRDLQRFAAGSAMSPETSTTVIVVLAHIDGGTVVQLDGPGFDGPRQLSPGGFDPEIWRALADNHAAFPVGVDVLLACGSIVIGLPRSTSVGTPSTTAGPTTEPERRDA